MDSNPDQQNNRSAAHRSQGANRPSTRSNGTDKAMANGGEGGENPKPWFQPKEGSVFPKRKTVKRMMGELVVNAFGSLTDKNNKTYPHDGGSSSNDRS
ncbi:hypothetical protein LOK49_LG05G02470 [Camellia lanceoleosa]|uniref:Uncharacterized protein n=1 Tax=Camellia lanceoleosa TaxID=1840588 RepID=A0ACC0HND1_9ERIC|nr:hypothetical protein LOK49_LG05G02470 [Camellia lanceoleosa]